MEILSKHKADRAIVDSLFTTGGTLACRKERFDMGKYQKTIIGRDVPEYYNDKIHLVWAERRKDKDGPYYALFCVSK